MSLPFASRDDRKAVESALAFAPKFDENGLIVAIATDHVTNEVLMVAYMNEESLRKTLELGEAVYFSRSRQEIWHKGATSGHVQKVKEIKTDCDQDALVLKVEQIGSGCCHAGYPSCFYRAVPLESDVTATDGDYPLTQQSEQSYDPDAVYKK
ncbi:phosphoribosyl-AMP cyclohydrolase [Sulfuriroseicoccus oceanibius]|uniref:Phosphoribosyl-AMP cyclohydrolase n=1 Tax=Sulfuriroseicoccus oceanibius TaxID=2707525 RepID=A0A6B3L5G5_9BACT|nr:phosphoribosyl-AMP cyclohydrolase [Sulfuriroseicoccus oceanibius]QQL44915.1 phosphoribosyl-AMP cyclohydrolase [Sulfuriroseicoccus oceanibius]